MVKKCTQVKFIDVIKLCPGQVNPLMLDVKFTTWSFRHCPPIHRYCLVALEFTCLLVLVSTKNLLSTELPGSSFQHSISCSGISNWWIPFVFLWKIRWVGLFIILPDFLNSVDKILLFPRVFPRHFVDLSLEHRRSHPLRLHENERLFRDAENFLIMHPGPTLSKYHGRFKGDASHNCRR